MNRLPEFRGNCPTRLRRAHALSANLACSKRAGTIQVEAEQKPNELSAKADQTAQIPATDKAQSNPVIPSSSTTGTTTAGASVSTSKGTNKTCTIIISGNDDSVDHSHSSVAGHDNHVEDSDHAIDDNFGPHNDDHGTHDDQSIISGHVADVHSTYPDADTTSSESDRYY